MQDSKDIAWARDYDTSTEEVVEEDRNLQEQSGGQSDPDGWQQYRRWISKAPNPRSRRTGVDPALYTWKGYRT